MLSKHLNFLVFVNKKFTTYTYTFLIHNLNPTLRNKNYFVSFDDGLSETAKTYVDSLKKNLVFIYGSRTFLFLKFLKLNCYSDFEKAAACLWFKNIVLFQSYKFFSKLKFSFYKYFQKPFILYVVKKSPLYI